MAAVTKVRRRICSRIGGASMSIRDAARGEYVTVGFTAINGDGSGNPAMQIRR